MCVRVSRAGLVEVEAPPGQVAIFLFRVRLHLLINW